MTVKDAIEATRMITRVFTGMIVAGIVLILAVAPLIAVVPPGQRWLVMAAVSFGIWLAVIGVVARRKGQRSLNDLVERRDGPDIIVRSPEVRSAFVRKWRRVEIGNTLAGLVASILAIAFLPGPAAAILVGFLVLAVGNTWYMGRRLRRTGQLFRPQARVDAGLDPADPRDS